VLALQGAASFPAPLWTGSAARVRIQGLLGRGGSAGARLLGADLDSCADLAIAATARDMDLDPGLSAGRAADRPANTGRR